MIRLLPLLLLGGCSRVPQNDAVAAFWLVFSILCFAMMLLPKR